jgi:hypothetical protein
LYFGELEQKNKEPQSIKNSEVKGAQGSPFSDPENLHTDKSSSRVGPIPDDKSLVAFFDER